MHAVIIAPHPSRPHCWQVRPPTMRQINLLTATVQNEKNKQQFCNRAIYVISRYMVIQLQRYKFKEVNKRFCVLMILSGLYRGIWWSSYRGIKLKEVNKWFWVLMILLGLYCGIRWTSYRNMEEANKWFWVSSDDTVMDHREIVIIVWYMLI